MNIAQRNDLSFMNGLLIEIKIKKIDNRMKRMEHEFEYS